MLDEEGSGYLDVMTNLAADLPARFIARLLGTPAEDFKKIRGWADAYMGTSTMSTEEKAASNVELHEYYTAQVAERYDMIKRGLADDDLLTGFITAEGDDGRNPHQKRWCALHHDGGRWC